MQLACSSVLDDPFRDHPKFPRAFDRATCEAGGYRRHAYGGHGVIMSIGLLRRRALLAARCCASRPPVRCCSILLPGAVALSVGRSAAAAVSWRVGERVGRETPAAM